MFRETLQALACLSVFIGTYSLHMARDSYRRPLSYDGLTQRQANFEHIPLHQAGLIGEQLEFPQKHKVQNKPGSDLETQYRQTNNLQRPRKILVLSNGANVDNNELTDTSHFNRRLSIQRKKSPLSLDDLFGTSTLDIRLTQPSIHEESHTNKRASPISDNINADVEDNDEDDSSHLQPISHGIASQLMLRSARGQRQYDVPQIECPPAMDGMERFACPTPDRQGRYRCIDDHVLCDGFVDCPDGDDEDRQACMFYKTTKAHLDVLADALLRWARGR